MSAGECLPTRGRRQVGAIRPTAPANGSGVCREWVDACRRRGIHLVTDLGTSEVNLLPPYDDYRIACTVQFCMPHFCTVRRSSAAKTKPSTSKLITITVLSQ